MILSIMILVMIAAVAFFHYIQGMFSATISAILALFAAVIALGYYETLTDMLLGGKFADTSHAMAIVVLFSGSYLVLRIIFDKMIPGNLRLPVLMDKIGAGVMGVVAGCIGAGVFAIAMQTMPFGMTIGGYSNYELEASRPVSLMMGRDIRRQDMEVDDVIKFEKNGEMTKQALMIPADSMVAGIVYHLSDKGSLAGGRTLASVHPDLIDELFFSRVGIPVGKKVTAVNNDSDQQINVKGLFQPRQLEASTGEVPEIRKFIVGIPSSDFEKQPETPSEPTSQYTIERKNLDMASVQKSSYVYLVVRIHADSSAAGDAKEGGLFSFSTGGIWLLVQGTDSDGNTKYEDVHPIGTLQGTDLVLTNALDDFLFAEQDKSIDLVFRIKASDIKEASGVKKPDGDSALTEWTVKDGTVLVVKRMARMDLSGMKVKIGVDTPGDVSVLRKEGTYKALGLVDPNAKPRR